MLTFLTPLAFAALLGLVVPVLIHLWERREGRRVLVGSIRWLEASEEQHISHLKFTDWWRFLLRALIITLFTFLLAAPIWRSSEEQETAASWILIEPGAAQEEQLQPLIDSLQQQGYSVRYLTSGFPAWEAGFSVEPSMPEVNYWSLLEEIAYQENTPDTVTVLAHPLLRKVAGKRPALPFVLRWQSLPELSAQEVIAAAWQEADEASLLLAQSGPTGVSYSRSRLPLKAGLYDLPPPFPPAVLQREAAPNTWSVHFAERQQDATAVIPTPQPTVWIYYDREWNDDQRFLRAALRAVSSYTGWSIDIKYLPVEKFELPEREEKEPWLFWLSESPLPGEVSAGSAFEERVVQIEKAAGYRGNYFKTLSEKNVLQRPLAPSEATDVDEQLPAELITLLFGDTGRLPAAGDYRYIAEEQLTPDFQTSASSMEKERPDGQSLHFPLWLLLCGLFVGERLIGRRRAGKEEKQPV